MCGISSLVSNKMNSNNGKSFVDFDHLREKLKLEYRFISSVLDRVPDLYSQDTQDAGVENLSKNTKSQGEVLKKSGEASRAQTIEELTERLEALKAKKKQSPRELEKRKNLEAKLKNKRKKDDKLIKPNEAKKKLEKNERRKLEIQQKSGSAENPTEQKPSKPVFNSEGKMVFSKFDFSDVGSYKDLKKKKKEVKDPKKILEKLKEKKATLKKLKEEGQEAKAKELQEKDAWNNALKKAEGVKVKDDPELLAKILKRKEAKKKTTIKKWASRKHGVNKSIKQRQDKRESNIQARKDAKKQKKRTKAIKKGRIIPGF